MNSPTEKQIEFVKIITEVLEIDFPQSSLEFTKQTYREFIKEHYDAYKQVVDDVNAYNFETFEDEMSWFQMLNG